METPHKIWLCEEIKEAFGEVMIHNRLTPLDESTIPAQFRCIRHYAEIWGLTDEEDRMQMIKNTPEPLLEDFCLLLRSIDDELEAWLCGDEADNSDPTAAYVCYTALVMAFDDAWSTRAERLLGE